MAPASLRCVGKASGPLSAFISPETLAEWGSVTLDDTRKRETGKGALYVIMTTTEPWFIFSGRRNLRLREVALHSRGHTAGEL